MNFSKLYMLKNKQFLQEIKGSCSLDLGRGEESSGAYCLVGSSVLSSG